MIIIRYIALVLAALLLLYDFIFLLLIFLDIMGVDLRIDEWLEKVIPNEKEWNYTFIAAMIFFLSCFVITLLVKIAEPLLQGLFAP